jgi:hypothetical protein
MLVVNVFPQADSQNQHDDGVVFDAEDGAGFSGDSISVLAGVFRAL